MAGEIHLPLVDEPIGEIVERLQAEDAAVAALAVSPRRQLAFRTFAYVRVGILLGRLLVERDVDPDAAGTWFDQLLAHDSVLTAVRAEVRAVAEEVAADPSLAEAEPVGPDDDTRERFRAFARRVNG